MRAFAGGGELGREAGGGFHTVNGRLEPILRELWSEAVEEARAARNDPAIIP